MSCFSTSPGKSLPTWLCSRGPVMLRKFVQLNKNNDLVEEVQLLDVNPLYANIRYSDGREGSVSTSCLSPCPRKPIGSEMDSQNLSVADEELNMRQSLDNICDEQAFLSIPETTSPRLVSQESAPINDVKKSVETAPPNINNTENDNTAQRKSSRSTKGAPPARYGYAFSH